MTGRVLVAIIIIMPPSSGGTSEELSTAFRSNFLLEDLGADCVLPGNNCSGFAELAQASTHKPKTSNRATVLAIRSLLHGRSKFGSIACKFSSSLNAGTSCVIHAGKWPLGPLPFFRYVYFFGGFVYDCFIEDTKIFPKISFESGAFATSHFGTTVAGTLLMRDSKTLYDVYMDGSIKNAISLDGERLITSFAFLPYHGLYVICALNKEKDSPFYEVFVYDEFGALIGKGVDTRNKDSEGLLMYQILTVGDKVFVNGMNANNSSDKGLLQEISVIPDGNNQKVYFNPVGQEFGPNPTTINGVNFRFCRIVEDPSYDRIMVVDSARPQAWFYEEKGHGEYYSLVSRPFDLKKYRMAFDEHRILREKVRIDQDNEQNIVRKLYSYSRITGFYNLGENFVIGYIRPNKNYPTFNNLNDPPPTKESPHPYILSLQRVDTNLNSLGKPLEFPGAFLIGTIESCAFVFQPDAPQTTKGYIEVVPNSFFSE